MFIFSLVQPFTQQYESTTVQKQLCNQSSQYVLVISQHEYDILDVITQSRGEAEEQVHESSTVSDSDDFQPCNKKQKLSLSKTKLKQE